MHFLDVVEGSDLNSLPGRKNTIDLGDKVMVVKVVLVGDEGDDASSLSFIDHLCSWWKSTSQLGVGKTSFLRRYHKDEFSVVYRATIGLDFCSPIIDLQGQQVKLQLWDTAGRPRYRSHTTNVPYRVASGVILMYDTTSRASFESVQGRWMHEIMGNIDEPNIMLCASCPLTYGLS